MRIAFGHIVFPTPSSPIARCLAQHVTEPGPFAKFMRAEGTRRAIAGTKDAVLDAMHSIAPDNPPHAGTGEMKTSRCAATGRELGAHGADALRIVDALVLSILVSGHTGLSACTDIHPLDDA